MTWPARIILTGSYRNGARPQLFINRVLNKVCGVLFSWASFKMKTMLTYFLLISIPAIISSDIIIEADRQQVIHNYTKKSE